MVYPERAADGATCKFIIKPSWLRQSLKRFLRIGQGIENGIALCAKDGAMNVVASRLSDNVYDRTRVAAIFRAEVTCRDLIFLNKCRVGHEQGRTSDGVIVVILTIDLLVVVPTADTIDFKARTVGIRKPQIPVARNARNRQRQEVQALVFQNPRELINVR